MDVVLTCPFCDSPLPASAEGECAACVLALGLTPTSRPDQNPEDLLSLEAASTAEYAKVLVDPQASTLPAAGESSVEVPPVLTEYELVKWLGRGGMGTVYEGYHTRLARTVAIKVMNAGPRNDPRMRKRFSNEARAQARVTHPNVVPVYHVGEDNGIPFIAMEFTRHGPVSRQIHDAAHPLPAKTAASIIESVANAVHHAHTADIIHRDIKPTNILIGPDGSTAKLADFGLARFLDGENQSTAEGTVIGTLAYMPPEQALGKKCGVAGDVYSLGATLYHLLAGRPPFDDKDDEKPSKRSIMEQVIHDAPPPLTKYRPDICPILVSICLKCLSKSIPDRYASAKALANDLAAWRQDRSTIARPQSWLGRTRRKIQYNWQIAAGLIGIGLIAWLASRITPVPKPAIEKDWVAFYQSELQAGRTVELVGESGGPKWFHWHRLIAINSFPTSGPLAFESSDFAMLELLPDPGVENYTIVAELRNTDVAMDDGSIGIFSGSAATPYMSEFIIRQLTTASLTDMVPKNRPTLKKVHVFGADILRLNPVNGDHQDQHRLIWTTENVQSTASNSLQPIWRTLSIHMTSKAMSLMWSESCDVEKTITFASRDLLQEEFEITQCANFWPALAKRNLKINLSPMPRRGSLGIYCNCASGQFRNVKVVPDR